MRTANNLERRDAFIDTTNQETLVVMLTAGNDDNGKRATLAYTAATCAAALHAEDGTEGGLADCQGDSFADVAEALGEADCSGRFAFAGWGRGDCGNDD